MKKRLLPILALPLLLVGSLASCGKNSQITKVSLTFGKVYDKSKTFAEQLEVISSPDLNDLILAKQNFILLVADPHDACSCFVSFKTMIRTFLEHQNPLIYCITPAELSKGESYSIKYGKVSGNEALAIFEEGKVKYQYQRKGENDDWGNNYEVFHAWIKERVHHSDMYYINEDQLKKMRSDSINPIEGWDHYVIAYFRGSCGDCQYVANTFLKEYNKKDHVASFVYDIETTDGYYLEDGTRDNVFYQNLKDELGLSTVNTELGYGTGFIPTFQYISALSIVDADVYFNDTVVKEGDGYKVSESYFSSSRTNPFLENVTGTKVLEGITLTADDVSIYGDYVMWNQKSAALYHDPLLQSFLDTYLMRN